MADVNERDIDAAGNVIERWHSMPNETRLMSWEMLIVGAIAQARAEGDAAGYRRGIEAAMQVLAKASADKYMTNVGLRWINSCYDQIRALLPDTMEKAPDDPA